MIQENEFQKKDGCKPYDPVGFYILSVFIGFGLGMWQMNFWAGYFAWMCAWYGACLIDVMKKQ